MIYQGSIEDVDIIIFGLVKAVNTVLPTKDEHHVRVSYNFFILFKIGRRKCPALPTWVRQFSKQFKFIN